MVAMGEPDPDGEPLPCKSRYYGALYIQVVSGYACDAGGTGCIGKSRLNLGHKGRVFD